MHSRANIAHDKSTSSANYANRVPLIKNFNSTTNAVCEKPKLALRHSLEIKRSQSCPSLAVKQEDKTTPEETDKSDVDISEQILKLAIDACTAGERIGIENQRRFCLKNIQSLCSKTKEHLKKSEVTDYYSQDVQLMTKNYIFSFIRVLDGWKCLEEVLREKHEAYVTIENEYYSPNIRETFYEWQSSTKHLLQHVYETFQTLSHQGDKLPARMYKRETAGDSQGFSTRPIINSQSNTNNQVRASNPKSQADNAEKSFQLFSEPLTFANCNVDPQTTISYEDKVNENYFGSNLSAVSEIPLVNSSIVVSQSRLYPVVQNSQVTAEPDWTYYSQQFYGENSVDQKSSIFDTQWDAALQSAPTLIDNILKTTSGKDTSLVRHNSKNVKKVKKKNARNEIKKIGSTLTNFLDVELFSKISNQNINKILTYRSMRKNSVTLSDVQNKLKKYHYNNVNDVLKDIERIFYSILEYLEMHPDEDLEKAIVYIREKFWTMVHDDLQIID